MNRHTPKVPAKATTKTIARTLSGPSVVPGIEVVGYSAPVHIGAFATVNSAWSESGSVCHRNISLMAGFQKRRLFLRILTLLVVRLPGFR